MKPMLARPDGHLRFRSFPAFIQPKLNGVRAIYQNPLEGTPIFQSRDEEIWQPRFVQHLLDELQSISGTLGHWILDGELYVHGWSLQRIACAMAVNAKVRGPNSDTPFVEYHIFDTVDPSRGFVDRYAWLQDYLLRANLPHIKVVPTLPVPSLDAARPWFHQWTSEGYEGLMFRTDSPYEYGERPGVRVPHPTSYRSKSLWKWKQWDEDTFLCVGSVPGNGKISFGFGALVLAHPQDHTRTFEVGTGFTDEQRAAPPPIGRHVLIRYLNLTDDGVPFNPSFKGVVG